MLRVAQRLGAGLDETFRHINNQLALDLPEDRFVTAFLGRLDPLVHDMRYHSGGQGPLLHFHAADGSCEMLGPTSAPLGTMAQVGSRPARFIEMMPGDIFVVCSDGVFDHENPRRQHFGVERVIELLRSHGKRPMAEMLGRLLAALEEFGEGVQQEDDVTVVLIRRLPESAGQSMRNIRFAPIPKELPAFQESFPRELEALSRIFDFVARFVVSERLGAAERYALGFTIEELFTNFLKYTPNGKGDIQVSLERRGHDVVGIMINPDTDNFDVTATPDVDIKLPAEQRKTGGLGLHLIRRVVDTIDYEYTQRTSRITFRKRIETRV
jgi:anti-sigma regulatory factor (Ser/Thr protein kinase)